MTENLSQLNDPVLITDSGHYDLNLIKKYFVTNITQPRDLKVANKQNKVMYMCTPMFRYWTSATTSAHGTSYVK